MLLRLATGWLASTPREGDSEANLQSTVPSLDSQPIVTEANPDFQTSSMTDQSNEPEYYQLNSAIKIAWPEDVFCYRGSDGTDSDWVTFILREGGKLEMRKEVADDDDDLQARGIFQFRTKKYEQEYFDLTKDMLSGSFKRIFHGFKFKSERYQYDLISNVRYEFRFKDQSVADEWIADIKEMTGNEPEPADHIDDADEVERHITHEHRSQFIYTCCNPN